MNQDQENLAKFEEAIYAILRGYDKLLPLMGVIGVLEAIKVELLTKE